MALTDKQRAAKLADRIFEAAGKTAHSDIPALIAGFQALDTAFNATTTQVENAAPGVMLKVALLNAVQADAPNLTTPEAAVLLALWALNEVDLL